MTSLQHHFVVQSDLCLNAKSRLLQGPLTMQKDYKVDFCFGIAIHPCDTPLSLNFYVEKPGDDKNDTYQEKITSGTQLQLPGIKH